MRPRRGPVHRLADRLRDHQQERQGQRQAPNPAATGPTPDSRTSHGPNASEQLPIKSAAKASGWDLG